MNVMSYQVCDYVMLHDKRDFTEVIKGSNQLTYNRETVQFGLTGSQVLFKSRKFSPADRRKESQEQLKCEKDSTHCCCFEDGEDQVKGNTESLQEQRLAGCQPTRPLTYSCTELHSVNNLNEFGNGILLQCFQLRASSSQNLDLRIMRS